MRGPGVAPGAKLAHLGSNVDLMPTVLGLAGAKTPDSMDGRSVAPLLLNASRAVGGEPWRTELLVEYYGLGNVVR